MQNQPSPAPSKSKPHLAPNKLCRSSKGQLSCPCKLKTKSFSVHIVQGKEMVSLVIECRNCRSLYILESRRTDRRPDNLIELPETPKIIIP